MGNNETRIQEALGQGPHRLRPRSGKGADANGGTFNASLTKRYACYYDAM